MARRTHSRNRFVPLKIKKAIMRYGKTYQAAECPDDIERGEPGKCFDWCMVQAINSQGKYRYVEGFTSEAHSGKMVLHAWLTDGVHAFDPTWGIEDKDTGHVFAMDLRYIGVEMDLKYVMQFVKATGYQGLLGNRWRAPAYVDEVLYRSLTRG